MCVRSNYTKYKYSAEEEKKYIKCADTMTWNDESRCWANSIVYNAAKDWSYVRRCSRAKNQVCRSIYTNLTAQAISDGGVNSMYWSSKHTDECKLQRTHEQQNWSRWREKRNETKCIFLKWKSAPSVFLRSHLSKEREKDCIVIVHVLWPWHLI